MANKLSNYLDSFNSYLDIDSVVKNDVAEEISTHLDDKIQDLKEEGLSEEEATEVATQTFGSPQLIARQIYETHAQGSWQEAIFAALPHILIAVLFTSFYWQSTLSLLITLAATACTVVYGWYHGKPVWLFPWLGYYMLPVIATAILLMYLSKGWIWVGALIYILLAIFALIYIVKQSIERDWLYTLLMLAPLPVVFVWLFSSGIESELLRSNVWMTRLQTNIPWISVSFLTLALANVIFIRTKPRWGKVSCLLIPPTLILFSVSLTSGGYIGSWGWVVLMLSLFALTTPALLKARL